jgi:hypothetical protein
MPKESETKPHKPSGFKKAQVEGAQRELLEQLFDDHYRFRWRIYKMNFFRGIFFGFGSAIGATLLVGILIWVLSFFTNLPVVGNFLHQSQTTIQKRTNN